MSPGLSNFRLFSCTVNEDQLHRWVYSLPQHYTHLSAPVCARDLFSSTNDNHVECSRRQLGACAFGTQQRHKGRRDSTFGVIYFDSRRFQACFAGFRRVWGVCVYDDSGLPWVHLSTDVCVFECFVYRPEGEMNSGSE